MYLENNKIILREKQESDIEDVIRWNTVETEWMLWDAPWEHEEDEASYDWNAYRIRKKAEIKDMQENKDLRMRLEICIHNVKKTHIGAVSCYFMDESFHIDEQGPLLAIGIVIYESKYRRGGYGSSAYTLYMEYLKSLGYQNIYTQTWSGNYPVLRMAENLGFKECNRYMSIRNVRGKRYDGLTLIKRL